MNIIQGFPTPQKDYCKVYVNSITFNQAPYIEDCLNGVAMQETNFPFVHHVIDDASTDGEQDVIKAWMDKNCDMEHAEYYDNDICTITIVKNKKNPNCTLAAYFLEKNMYGNPKKCELFTPWREVCPYEALCEGDDYWIDPKKLQKQVDFLDSHSDFSLCFSNVKVLNNKTRKFQEDHVSVNALQESTIQDLAKGNYIHTQSVLYRIDCTLGQKIQSLGPISLGDYPTWLLIAEKGKLYKFNEQMCVYRLGSGLWSDKSYTERLVKTIVMLCKLRMIIQTDDVREIIDLQIMNYQNSTIEEYNHICNEKNEIINSRTYKVGQKLQCVYRKFGELLRLQK